MRVEARLHHGHLEAALVVIAVLATLAVSFAIPAEPPVRVLLGAMILLMGLRALDRLREAQALVLEGDAIQVFARGAWHAGRVRPGCFVAPWLTVILWRPGGAWCDRALVLLPGAAQPGEMRKIRVLLRWA